MLLARRFAAAVTAFLLIAGGYSVLLFATTSPAAAASDSCVNPAEVTVLPSPQAPWSSAPLRVMVVSEKPVEGVLSLIAPGGSVAVKSPDRHGGPPYSWFAEVAAPVAGTWHAKLERDPASADCNPITRDIVVSARKPDPVRIPAGSIWQVSNNWNSTNEALFSAWIEKLFDAPPDQDLSWKAWHEVLRDQSRNFLFNYLGRGEDNAQTGLRPDCADFVYFLRAYFAFKIGLPFGYTNCSRGFAGKPPQCYQWFDVEHPEVTRPPPPPEKDVAPAADTPPAENSAAAGFVWPLAAGRATNNSARESISAEAEASDEFWRIFARHRRRRPYRGGTRRRRQRRFLHRAADATGAAPGDGIRRPVRPRADAGASRAGSERHSGRLPGRRRRARRIDHAEAFLARQLPFCARTLARHSRLQAFPPRSCARRTVRCGG